MLTFTLTERLLARFKILPTPIYDVLVAPLFGRCVALSVRLNLFEALSEPKTSLEISRTVNIHPQAASLLLSTLAVTGYVRKHREHFTLTAAGRKWFLRSSPTYLGNLILYVEMLYKNWLYLGETARHGNPPTTYFESFGEKEWETYVLGMRDLASIIYPRIASKLALPEKARQLIDLGGSHGFYSIAMCKRHRGLRATIVDTSQALKFTRREIREHGLEERITLQYGDVLTCEFEKEKYDVAFAFNICHGFTGEQNVLFFSNIFHSMKPGGCLYILDQCPVERGSQTERLIPFMVGINSMNEVGGNVYTVDQYRQWVTERGFKRLRAYRLPLPGVYLFKAIK